MTNCEPKKDLPKGWQYMTHANGAPMFQEDGMMLDENGQRSIFDDVDEGPEDDESPEDDAE